MKLIMITIYSDYLNVVGGMHFKCIVIFVINIQILDIICVVLNVLGVNCFYKF